MSLRYRLTPLAFDDLYDIWLYIAKDGVDAANRVEAAIYDACARLSRNPYLGKKRKSRANKKEVRIWTVPRFPSYKLVYYPDTKPLLVVAVLHGRRDLDRILRKRTGK